MEDKTANSRRTGTSPAEAGTESAPKRAVVYIRVSTKQQAMRDGNPEGYSLPTQRQACMDRARQLSAVVVDEYIDKDTGTAVTTLTLDPLQ